MKGMFTMPWRINLLLPVLAVAACVAAAQAQSPAYSVGRTPSAEEIRAWDNAIGPSGKELPPGRGTAPEGVPIYGRKCAGCHGPTGSEGPAVRLVGGQNTLTSVHSVKTVGSYWPFATTIWDFINRAMPPKQEGTLSANEVYALTAVLLYWNGIIQESEVMDAKTLPKVPLPNRNGFIPARVEDLRLGHCRQGSCP